MKKITLVDVAEEAGVSVSAVSRYLNETGYVSKAKKEAIIAAIDKLGYAVPIRRAKQSDRIALIGVKHKNNPFHHRLWCELFVAANKQNKAVVFIAPKNEEVITKTNLRNCIDRSLEQEVEGIIVFGYMDDHIDESLSRFLSNLDIPVVFLEYTGNCHEVNTVTFNEDMGISKAVDHFYEMGHRDIGFIGMISTETEVANNRYGSFVDAMTRKGLDCRTNITSFTYEYTIEAGRYAMQQILLYGSKLTAVFCGSDILAMGAIQAINENRMIIPRDISIIGHDDCYATLCSPTLTSVAYPFEEAAEKTIELITRQYMDKDEEPQDIVFDLSLKRRNSVRFIK